jgi:hypothetical protein
MRRLTGWAGTLAVAIVAMTIGAALGGAATGARTAVEAAPAAEPPTAPAAQGPSKPPAQMHSAFGRVMARRENVIRVRTPEGEVVRVRVLAQTLIRKANTRVDVDAIEPGDRLLAVGRMNANGVLVARGVLVQPGLRRPAEGSPPPPAPDDGAVTPKPQRPLLPGGENLPQPPGPSASESAPLPAAAQPSL